MFTAALHGLPSSWDLRRTRYLSLLVRLPVSIYGVGLVTTHVVYTKVAYTKDFVVGVIIRILFVAYYRGLRLNHST